MAADRQCFVRRRLIKNRPLSLAFNARIWNFNLENVNTSGGRKEAWRYIQSDDERASAANLVLRRLARDT